MAVMKCYLHTKSSETGSPKTHKILFIEILFISLALLKCSMLNIACSILFYSVLPCEFSLFIFFKILLPDLFKINYMNCSDVFCPYPFPSQLHVNRMDSYNYYGNIYIWKWKEDRIQVVYKINLFQDVGVVLMYLNHASFSSVYNILSCGTAES